MVFAEHDTNEHETCVVHVLLDLDLSPDLQAAKVGAMVLKDIIGTDAVPLVLFCSPMPTFAYPANHQA